jgi:hypothetical protein
VVAMKEAGKEAGSRRRASAPSSKSGGTRGRSDGPDLVEELKQLTDRAGEVAGVVRDNAGNAARQVKDKATEMTRAITSTIKEEAEHLFDEQKGKAASKVKGYGKVVHQAAHALHAVKADGLAEYVDSAGAAVEGITDYLEERNLAQVLEDVGEVARSHPGMMIGGMFVTGLALARFLKASGSREEEGQESDGESGGEEEEQPSRGPSRRR